MQYYAVLPIGLIPLTMVNDTKTYFPSPCCQIVIALMQNLQKPNANYFA